MVSRDGEAVAAIHAYNRALLAAIGAADLAAIEALTYDQCITFGAGRPAVIGRQATLEIYARSKALFAVEEVWDADETLVDGDQAYQRGTQRIRVTLHASGKVLETGGAYLNVYRRLSEGRWMLTLNSFVPAEGQDIWDEVMAG